MMTIQKKKTWARIFAIVLTLAITTTGISTFVFAVDTDALGEVALVAASEEGNVRNTNIQESQDGLAVFPSGSSLTRATLYINNFTIGANSALNVTSVTGNYFTLVKGRLVYYDLTWFPRNDVKVGLWDVDTGTVKNAKTIKNGSATGSITVPADGHYYFYIENTGSSLITVNGTFDP